MKLSILRRGSVGLLFIAALISFCPCRISWEAKASQKWQEPSNPDAEEHYRRGQKFLQDASYSNAFAEVEAVLKSQPDFPPAYTLRGQALIGLFNEGFVKGGFAGRSKSAPLTLFELLAEAAHSFEQYTRLRPQAADAARWQEYSELLRPYVELLDITNPSRDVFLPEELKEGKARVIRLEQPEYPEGARRGRTSGSVVFVGILRTDGTIGNILIVESLTNGLTERAIEAARKTKFKPATKDGRAVRQVISLKYGFMVS